MEPHYSSTPHKLLHLKNLPFFVYNSNFMKWKKNAHRNTNKELNITKAKLNIPEASETEGHLFMAVTANVE